LGQQEILQANYCLSTPQCYQDLVCRLVVDVLQQPKGRDVEDEDIFTFNDDFIAPLFRIKVHSSFRILVIHIAGLNLSSLPANNLCNYILELFRLWFVGF
jgi:hypothetical protein